MARPLAEVVAELKGLECGPDNYTLEAVCAHLNADERIELAVYGKCKISTYDDGKALLATTSLRVLKFERQVDWLNRSNPSKCWSLKWSEIASVGLDMNYHDTSFWHEFVALGYPNMGAVFVRFESDRNFNKQGLIGIGSAVRERVDNAKAKMWSGTNAKSDSLTSELERLGGLRTRGVLTEEEFQVAKRKLLS